MNKTEKVLIEMLKENTGSHMLDSGGAYGRNWERNQSIDFTKSTPTFLEMTVRGNGNADYGELDIMVTHNVFHFLKDRLKFDPKMQKHFDTHAKQHEDDGWLVVMESFPEYLKMEMPDSRIGGIYGDGEPVTHNTYNGEDLLSQTLQFMYFEVDGEGYVLLQIHGGCDVRGGYTAPRAFQVRDEMGIFDNARAAISCGHCDANWYTDDTCHFYAEGCAGYDAGRELQNYPAIELEEVPVPATVNPDLFKDGETIGGDYEHKGYVVVVDRQGYCPLCGGKLIAFA